MPGSTIISGPEKIPDIIRISDPGWGTAWGPSAASGCKVAHVGPADDIAPHVPHSPPSAGGFQELYLVVEVEGGDLGCRHGGAIPEGQAVDVDNVHGRRWRWRRHFRGRRGCWF